MTDDNNNNMRAPHILFVYFAAFLFIIISLLATELTERANNRVNIGAKATTSRGDSGKTCDRGKITVTPALPIRPPYSYDDTVRIYTKNWNPSSKSDSVGKGNQSNVPYYNRYTRCKINVGCKSVGPMPEPETCIHLTETYALFNGHILEANTDKNDGYCFYTKDELQKTCDSRVSVPILTVTETNSLRMRCQCHWPSLFDQSTIFDNCNIRRACNYNADKLLHVTSGRSIMAEPLDTIIDIHKYKCSDCGPMHESGKNPDTGLPDCIPKRMGALSDMNGIYEALKDELGPEVQPFLIADSEATTTSSPFLPLTSRLIDNTMRTGFDNSVRSTAYIPNPCAFDHIDGTYVGSECVLRSSRSGIAYCSPLSENISTLVTNGDYLSKNNGVYANACYRFTTSDANVIGYQAEFFVRQLSIESRKTIARLVAEEAATAKRESRVPAGIKFDSFPLPVISVQVPVSKITPHVRRVFGMVNERDVAIKPYDNDTIILVTQAPVPDDSYVVPVPLDHATMLEYRLEYNDYGDILPARCFPAIPCGAPLQSIRIPTCNEVGTTTRDPNDASVAYTLFHEGFDYNSLMFNSIVSCKEPNYDSRLHIVPQIDVAEINGSSNPAILRFDKKTKIVHPHWPDGFSPNMEGIVQSYINLLPSRPSKIKLLTG